ncbi:MAG: hypothetical protein RSC08_07210 [Oscillospiraceae bacterium]
MKHLEKYPKNVVFCICFALLLVFPTSCGQAVTPDAPTQALEFVFSRSADSSVNPEDIPAALSPLCTEDGLAFMLENRFGWTLKTLAAQEDCTLHPSEIKVSYNKTATEVQSTDFALTVTVTHADGTVNEVAQHGTMQLAPKDGAILVESMWIANPDELTLAIGAN